MKTVTEHIRQHLLEQKGMIEAKRVPDLESLRATEWCPEFEGLMRNRLVMGAFRYCPFAEHADNDYDYLTSMRKRLDAYERDKNLEHLVDVANMAMTRFRRDRVRGATLRPVDDGEHAQRTE